MKVVMTSVMVVLSLWMMFGALATATEGSTKNVKKTGKRSVEVKDPRFKDKTIVNQRSVVHQTLQRLDEKRYGTVTLDKRRKELEDLLDNPPLGSFDSYCFAQRNNNRGIFTFFGILAPELSFVYLSSLGRLLQLSNPSNNTPRYYHDYFDYVMLYTGCEGSGGDRLVKAVWDMYQMEMFVKEKLEVSTGVIAEVNSMSDHLEMLLKNNTVLFKPSCQLNAFKSYFTIKMQTLGTLVKDMDIFSMTDLQMQDVIFEYFFIVPYASTYYLCVGYRNERENEAGNEKSIMYKMRKAFNKLMSREMEREAYLMNSLKEEKEKLNEDYYRHRSFVLEPNTTLFCGNMSGPIEEKRILNLYPCGRMCSQMYSEEKRLMNENGGNACSLNGTKVPCSACFVVYPPEQVPVNSTFSNVGIYVKMKNDHHVVVFPERNLSLPNLLMPNLTTEHVLNLSATNMIWLRPTPPKTEFPVYPKRANYIPHKTRGEIDWEWLKWTSIKLYCGITVGIWTIYFTVGNYFYIRRWVRRRLGWA